MITNIDQKSSGLDFKLAFFGKNFLSRSNSLTRRSFYAKMLFVGQPFGKNMVFRGCQTLLKSRKPENFQELNHEFSLKKADSHKSEPASAKFRTFFIGHDKCFMVTLSLLPNRLPMI